MICNKPSLCSLAILLLLVLVYVSPVLGQPGASSQVYLPVVGNGTAHTTVFGLEMSRVSHDSGLDLVVTSGARWIRRNGLFWKDVQPQPDAEYNWNSPNIQALEAEMILAARHNLNLIMIVRGSPQWAVTPHTADCAPINPQYYEEFAAFMAAVVARYSAPPFNVRYWEIGNEPDAPLREMDHVFGCWGLPHDPYYNGRAYGEMLKVVYPAIKRVNPHVQVLNGGLMLDQPYPQDGNPHLSRFLEGMLEAGAGNSFDILSFHTYNHYAAPGFPPLGPAQDWRIQYTKNLLQRHGHAAKPMIRSETGLLCVEVTPECRWAQADYLTRVFVRSLAEDLLATVWYVYDNDSYHNTALIEPFDVFVPRPAYYAFRHTARILHQAAYLEQLTNVPATTEAHRLQIPAGEIVVIWSDDLPLVQVQLPVPPSANVTCSDRDGGILPCQNQEGLVNLNVGYSPIFVQVQAP